MELNLIDRKLLYELDKDCRQSLSSLAKKLRIHRNVALYRIKKLEQKGIIKGYFTEINIMALGYFSFRVFLKLSRTTKEDELRLIKYLKTEKNIIWFFKVLGKWDLDFVFIAKNILEFNDFFKKFMLKFNPFIEDKSVSLLTQIYHFPKDYFLKKRREPGIKRYFIPSKKKEFDDIDLKILYLMSNNANINIVNLSEKVNLSINTLKKRIKELKRKKIILGFRVFIDTNKLGYNYYKLHINLKNYNEKDHSKFLTFLESKSFVVYVDNYINGEDFEIEIHLKTESEFLEFLDQIKENFGKKIGNHFIIKFYEELVFRYLPGKE